MARKSLKEIQEEEQKILNQKKANTSGKNSSKKKGGLFANIEKSVEKKNADIETIKEDLIKNATDTQSTYYLSKELLKILKVRSMEEDKSVAYIIREQLINNYFTEEELRKAYEK